MKAGNTFSFSALAGVDGFPLPYFRAIDFAYLRDRVVLAPKVTALLMPPAVTLVIPPAVEGSAVQVTVVGSGFSGTPRVRLYSPAWNDEACCVTVVSPNEISAWIFPSGMLPGLYDIEVENADGQAAVLEAFFTVQ